MAQPDNKQLWGSIPRKDQRHLIATNKHKDIAGNPINYGKLEGGEVPGNIVTAIPPSMWQDKDFDEKADEWLGGCLGPECKVRKHDTIGLVFIKVINLSADGGRRLMRGHWSPPKAADGTELGPTALAMDKRTPFASDSAAVLKLRSVDALLVHWDTDTSDKSEGARKAALEKHQAIYDDLVDLMNRLYDEMPDELQMMPVTGKKPKGDEVGVPAKEPAQAWKLGEMSWWGLVHRHSPPASYRMHDGAMLH